MSKPCQKTGHTGWEGKCLECWKEFDAEIKQKFIDTDIRILFVSEIGNITTHIGNWHGSLGGPHMIRRIRKWWICRRFGICSVHGVLRPHGGYAEGRWGICPKCLEENTGKATHRDVMHETARQAALEKLDKDWRV